VGEIAKLNELARAQFGLFTRKQAEDNGFTEDGIKWKLRRGEWEKFRRGVFRFRGAHASWSQFAMGTLLQGGPNCALSHGTAAFLWGLDGFTKQAPRIIDLTSTGDREWGGASVRLHTTRDAEIPTETVRGLRVTTMARTLVDLTTILKPEPLEMALDCARRKRKMFPKELDEYLKTVSARRGRIITLKDLLAERASPLDSAQEVTMLQEVLKRGLPPPIPGFSVFHLGKFVMKVDLGWKDRKVAGHFDSYLHHSGRKDFDRDAMQRAQLVLAGWTSIIVTKRTLMSTFWSDALRKLLCP
jgi:hypothetical protein